MAQLLQTEKTIGNKAFHVSSHYDPFSTISIRMKLFSKQSIADGKTLRYGENPHQKDSSLVILTPCLINYTEKNYHTITYLM
jgi:AICAR transformylase/IMP cyclohydrolase PurH